jgi:pimeloyl-ACP methyl ester carboxylesterase
MRVEAIQATTADGLTLRGEIVRGGDTWVLLVHDVGGDIDAWHPLRPGLVARGWTVLALDLRGHGGSDGEWLDDGGGVLDVDLGIILARRLGAHHVAVVAAGTAGVLALQAVERALADPSLELPDSLVLLSPGPLDGADPMRLRGGGLPKIVFSGAFDSGRPDVEALRRASIGWTLAVSVASDAHGTGLLDAWAPTVLDKLGTFLTEQAALRGIGRTRAEARGNVPTPAADSPQ